MGLAVTGFVDWDERPLDVRFSRGSKVPYVVNWRPNVLGLDSDVEPPGFLHQQVSRYVARRTWFTLP